MEERLRVQLIHPAARLPERASAGSAGYDLFSVRDVQIMPGQVTPVYTGVVVELPSGTYGRIAPRSSLAQRGINVFGGVIDTDYRGELVVLLHNISSAIYSVRANDKVAQLIIERIAMPLVERVEALSETARGAGGFGSTGN